MVKEVWEFQAGTSATEHLYGGFFGSNGTYVFAGSTRGSWSGTNAGEYDWTAFKVDARGEIVWRWQNGTGTTEVVEAAAMAKDESVVLVGHRWNNDGFLATKLDVDGVQLWQWEDGTTDRDHAYALAMTDNDSTIIAGTTGGDWNSPSQGGLDFAASKLHANGTLLWKWQDGTDLNDILYAAAVGENGSVLFAGTSYGEWSDLSFGVSDFVAIKLDPDGREAWRWQSGTTDEDLIRTAAIGNDGSVFLTGTTRGVWSGANEGERDFAACKLDANGAEEWRWQGGTAEDDVPFGITAGEDGSVVITGHTFGAWDGASSGEADFAAVKLDANGVEVWRWQRGSSDDDLGLASASSSNNSHILVAGSTKGPWASDNVGGYDFAAFLLDTEAPPSSAPTANGWSSDKTTLAAVFSGMIILMMMVGAGRVYCRRARTIEDAAVDFSSHSSPLPGKVEPPRQEKDTPSPRAVQHKGHVAEAASITPLGAMPNDVADEGSHGGHPSPLSTPTQGGAGRSSADGTGIIAFSTPESTQNRQPPTDGGRKPVRRLGYTRAAMAAAQELALVSQIPGIPETARLVIILMNLVTDSTDLTGAADKTVKRCRSVLVLLERASNVLQQVDSAKDPAHCVLVEDVRDAVGDLVEIIKTYQSKGKISQVMMSTLFKQRQSEAEEIIKETVARLQFGLQVQGGLKMDKIGQDVREILCLQQHQSEVQRSEREASASMLLEARRMRRQRNLDRVEIPEHCVTLTDELLGRGGFGAVYLADYNGRNAAAKVVHVEHDLGGLGTLNEEMAHAQLRPDMDHDNSRRKAFWRELEAMRRLRSPHTVNQYGAITSRSDRLVLVMELLTGGDLRALLKNATEPLAEDHSRRIVGDICAGMSFLHRKQTVHGDLKSPNVLFDGAGRAKIGDFGTSKWPHLTNSTGLATFTTTSSQSAQMSYAWAAPEVLDTNGTSYASDVYSFGVVVWEVLSRSTPWADECRRNIYVRVVIKEQRPPIPAESPADLAKVVNACWDGVPSNRPTFNDIMKLIRWE